MTKFEHPLSKKERILITDLQDYPLITYRDNNPLGIYIRDLFVEHQITPNIVFSFDDEITISKMVDEDFGIAVLANLHGLQNFLSIIPLNLKSDSPIIYLVYHRNTNHSKEIKNFINHLKTSTKL